MCIDDADAVLETQQDEPTIHSFKPEESSL